VIKQVGDFDKQADIGQTPEVTFIAERAHGEIVATFANFFTAKQKEPLWNTGH
jgi:hypothetical protein